MVASKSTCVLIRQRLWYADGRDGWACVNGPDRECLLLLFTSREGAREYFSPTAAPDSDLPMALIFSEDEREFRRLARDAFLEGVDGALIVSDGDEGVLKTLLRFAVDEAK